MASSPTFSYLAPHGQNNLVLCDRCRHVLDLSPVQHPACQQVMCGKCQCGCPTVVDADRICIPRRLTAVLDDLRVRCSKCKETMLRKYWTSHQCTSPAVTHPHTPSSLDSVPMIDDDEDLLPVIFKRPSTSLKPSPAPSSTSSPAQSSPAPSSTSSIARNSVSSPVPSSSVKVRTADDSDLPKIIRWLNMYRDLRECSMDELERDCIKEIKIRLRPSSSTPWSDTILPKALIETQYSITTAEPTAIVLSETLVEESHINDWIRDNFNTQVRGETLRSICGTLEHMRHITRHLKGDALKKAALRGLKANNAWVDKGGHIHRRNKKRASDSIAANTKPQPRHRTPRKNKQKRQKQSKVREEEEEHEDKEDEQQRQQPEKDKRKQKKQQKEVQDEEEASEDEDENEGEKDEDGDQDDEEREEEEEEEDAEDEEEDDKEKSAAAKSKKRAKTAVPSNKQSDATASGEKGGAEKEASQKQKKQWLQRMMASKQMDKFIGHPFVVLEKAFKEETKLLMRSHPRLALTRSNVLAALKDVGLSFKHGTTIVYSVDRDNTEDKELKD